MRNRYVLAALAAMMAVSMVCADELEPPWEVRTFIAPTTDGSFTQNMSVVRKQWVCPICGYSTHVAPYSHLLPVPVVNYDECPDPWGLGHAVTQLLLATPMERLCGHVGPASTLIGRPFHPGEPDPMIDPDWNNATPPWAAPTAANAASYVHVRAAGLYSPAYYPLPPPNPPPAPTDYLMDSTNAKVRFLVIEPGAVRAAATAVDLADVNPDDATDAFDPTDWTIHVNPYRVSDGDTWYVRQHEETDGDDETTVLTIEVYSKLYGSDFALNAPAPDATVELDDFENEKGCQIISNSGAVRIDCPRMLDGTNEAQTYVMGFTIRSNTQTLPCPEEVDYDTVAGCGDLYTDDPLDSTINREPISMVGQNKPPPNAAETWTWADVPFLPKEAWMEPDDSVIYPNIAGYVGTDLDVVEKVGNGFTTDECWPYRIPAGAVGLGKVIVQWSDGTTVGAALEVYDPWDDGDAGDSETNTYYREGGEWYYHADLWLDDAAHPIMYEAGTRITWEGVALGNDDVANGTAIPGDRDHYYMIDCSFLSTRPDVPLTGDTWAASGLPTPVEDDTDPGSGGYTRVIVGERIDSANPSRIGGQYNPGSSTPDRPFYVANRIIESTLVSPLHMGGSGARFRDDGVLHEGDPDPLSKFVLRCDNCAKLYAPSAGVGTGCTEPGCTGTLQWPVTLERVDADSQVAYAPLEALLVNFPAEGRRITLSPEAIRFGPDNSTVPVGVAELLQTVRISIPKYQPPSVPAPAGGPAVENDLANDNPYEGSVLAYTRHVTDPALVFTDGFETHASGWTQYVGNNPDSLRGALVFKDAGGNGTGTRTTNDYAVANTRYTWRAMPRYTGSGPGQVYFALADGAVVVGNESKPNDGIWTRFTGYSDQPGGDLGGAGGWSVEVREGSAMTWSDHYQDLNTNAADGIENTSDTWYEFAIEIGPDLKPKFYYGGRLLGTSTVALGSAADHAVYLCTRSGDALVDYVNAESLTSVRALERDAQWQAYYVSPNDGDKIPAGLAARMRTGQAGAAHAPVAGEFYCPVSDIRYSQLLAPVDPTDSAKRVCDFTGANIETFFAELLPEETLTAEEYDVFNLRVSVLRKADVASDQRTVDLGWVAPGVAAANPTTTAGALRPDSSSQPSDESSRQDLTLRNEGNVPVLSSMRAGYMFRPEIDGSNRSRARWSQSVPSLVGTLFRYRPTASGDVAFDTPNLELVRQDSDGAAGMQATAMLQAGVRATATEPYGPRTMPVPMGQPVGNYTGEMLVFIDLDGDGHLDFFDADAGVTSTASEPFDPEVDEPYEPVAAFATRMRVVETRLPQNDYYSKDVSPTGIYDVSRSAMQILWAGTRVSAPGTTEGTAAASGTSADDAASPTSPFNVLYTNATLNSTVEATADPYYRGWLWEAGDAKVLSNDAAGTNNTAPVAYVDPNNDNRWVMWHRQSTSAAGMATELRFDSSTTASTDWTGSSITEFIYGTSGAKQGLTGFVRAGAANNHWLFWHGGTRGNEIIRYRWDFDPNAALVNDNEAPLPVSNAVARGSRQDVVYEEGLTCGSGTCGAWHDPQVFDPTDVCTVCGGALLVGDSHGYKKPGHYPFTYTKDPSVFERTSGGRPFVHAFFSGLVRATGNADICWVRFNEERMQWPAANYGKAAFPEVADNNLYMPAVGYTTGMADRWAGEQMRPSGVSRRTFQSRGIDWMISDDTQDDPADGDTTNFATAPDVTPRWAGGYGDPELFVGVVTNGGGVLAPTVYRLTWTKGTYERATGTYIVTPMLTEIRAAGDVDIAIPPGHPHGSHVNELLEPSTRMNVTPAMPIEEWPSVRLRINPASGTVTWSAPLFNPDAPGDPRAIFNTDYDPDILDVLMYANYTPYVYRVTTDGANDDSPSAFYDLGDSSRLTVFWRRSFGTADTPHFGRAAFMHKTYTTALQVGQPPINPAPASITLVDLNDGGTVPYVADGPNGIITITDDSRVGNLIRVTYTSLATGGQQTEVHRIVGWSTETPVPVNSVVSEGRLRVVPEIYKIPDGVGGPDVDVVRYWLLWSSPRASYDVRNHSATTEGQNVRQSSDVYCAVVSPEYGSLIREADVPRVGP